MLETNEFRIETDERDEEGKLTRMRKIRKCEIRQADNCLKGKKSTANGATVG